MGMGKAEIPWVPWDFHEYGKTINRGTGMGIRCMGMGIETLEWEKITAHCN